MHWSLAVHLVAGSKKGKENSLAQAHNLTQSRVQPLLYSALGGKNDHKMCWNCRWTPWRQDKEPEVKALTIQSVWPMLWNRIATPPGLVSAWPLADRCPHRQVKGERDAAGAVAFSRKKMARRRYMALVNLRCCVTNSAHCYMYYCTS